MDGGRVREVALVFLRLGVVAFGGPAAHTAMMRDEVVRRRGWISDERFADLMGATNLIPGPNSTELAIHLGHERARWRGLVTAGVCFILPAAVIVTALAWAYVRFGQTPAVSGLLYGIVPAVVAIIAHALFALLKAVLKTVWLILLAAAALTAYLLGVNELLILAAGAALPAAIRLARGGARETGGPGAEAGRGERGPGERAGRGGEARGERGPGESAGGGERESGESAGGGERESGESAGGGEREPGESAGRGEGEPGERGRRRWWAGRGSLPVLAFPVVDGGELGQLFLTMVKIGSVLYGSGYVLLAFLRGDFVDRLHWITEQQLYDAVSIGQVTPGPVFTTATFIGYLVAGLPGAFLATVGVFLPSFLFVGLLARLTDRLRASPWTSVLLDGVNATALALMAGVSGQLARSAVVDPLTAAITVVTLLLMWRTRWNSAWFIAAGALIGLGHVLIG